MTDPHAPIDYIIKQTLRWMLIAAQARIDVFRTQEASNRFLERSTI